MARKETFIKGILTDSSQNQGYLGSLTEDQWLQGVLDTLDLLYNSPPCTTSKPILDGITATGKTVTIIPSHVRAVGPDKEFGNAFTTPVEWRKTPQGDWLWSPNYLPATAPGKPTENDEHDPRRGVGGGSDSLIEFVAQDFDPVQSASSSLKPVDEALLHELVHALRQTLGQEDNTYLPPATPTMSLGNLSKDDLILGKGPPPTMHTQIYENLEEFSAILMTNIYRSENRRFGLVRDHLAPRPRRGEPPSTPDRPFHDPHETTRTLGYPLTNPRHFLTLWREQVKQLFRDLSQQSIVQKIAIMGPNFGCDFNPFWELVQERTRPQAAAYAH
jgi:hypothetical protein